MPGDSAGHPDGRGGTCTCCLPDIHRPSRQAPQREEPSRGFLAWLLGDDDRERD